MLVPKKVKHRKQQKGKMTGLAKGGAFIDFGDFGMQSLDRCWLTAQQIEACRVTINRTFSRKGKVWIRVFPDKPITQKPLEVRQGKGKGNVEYWVAQVKPGKVLYEMQGITEAEARDAFRLAAAKLPFQTMFVKRTVM